MTHEKKRITNNKKPVTQEQKRARIEKQHTEWGDWDYSIHYCWLGFIVAQQEKGNRKDTIEYYKRFYEKFKQFIDSIWHCSTDDLPIELLTNDITQPLFMQFLEKTGNKQTVNSYLRAYRSFGNWCENKGYTDGFTCPIKEEEPPIKEVFTDKEIDTLLVKPKITEFAAYRMYAIIVLILNTGARSNTIRNIRLSDIDIEEGYINFNTTKAHKVVRLALDKKARIDLAEWVNYWRYGKGAEPLDYLFCNEYGEQMSRATLGDAMRRYCLKRGVEKTSIHLLRHTFAKKWITSGGDIFTLQKILTHSELDMVKRYSNLYGSDIKKEIMEHSALSQMKTRSGATLKSRKSIID